MWENDWKDTIVYNNNNKIIDNIQQNWDSVAWVNNWRDTFAFNTNGTVSTDISEAWDSIAWVNYYLDTFSYDNNNNILVSLDKEWNDTAWVNSWKRTFTYDAFGSKLTDLFMQWDSTAWDSLYSRRLSFTYDANENSVTGKSEYWQSGNWLPSEDTIALYSKKKWIYCVQSGNYYRYQASFHALPTGITDKDVNNSRFAVYPNPASEEIQVISNQCPVSGIEIYNLLGGKIYNTLIADNRSPFTINIADFPSGMYIVEVKTEKEIAVKKLVKE